MKTILETTIPAGNKELTDAKLKKLNKRAVKLGCKPVELVVVGTEKKEKKHPVTREVIGYVEYLDIELRGEIPKLAGWEFIGTLDLVTLPGKVIVKAVPGHEVPTKYRDTDGYCDHCKTRRYRLETFVVRNEDGEYKAVGRNCLRDFLGHNPAAVIAFLHEFDCWGEEWGGWKLPDPLFDKVKVLEVTGAVINLYGWVPKSKADYETGLWATAGRVFDYFHPPKRKYKEEYKAWVKFFDEVNGKLDDRCKRDAENTFDWIKDRAEKNNSDYIHNLVTIADADGVPARLFGYWCSAIASYLRDKARIEEETVKVCNEYVGEIKKRLEFRVKVTGIKWIETFYGGSCIHNFIDEDGHKLTWFATNGSDMETGLKYTIKGTVKKHEEYNGIKTTYLNRVAVVA